MNTITKILLLLIIFIVLRYAFSSNTKTTQTNKLSSNNSDSESQQTNNQPSFPKHWTDKPLIVTRDYVQFPKPFDKYYGSSTIVSWIQNNQKNDKTSPWENLVGLKALYAKQVIQQNRPELKIFIIDQNSLVTQDYRTDRVRIFTDSDQNVVGGSLVPKIG